MVVVIFPRRTCPPFIYKSTCVLFVQGSDSEMDGDDDFHDMDDDFYRLNDDEDFFVHLEEMLPPG